jgi:hypothetical protein
MKMNSSSSSALPSVLCRNELPQDAVSILDTPSQYKRSLPPKFGGRLLKEKNPGLIVRVTQQVFPLFQPAIQWWQLELLRLQRDSFQSLQAQWWEPELSQE